MGFYGQIFNESNQININKKFYNDAKKALKDAINKVDAKTFKIVDSEEYPNDKIEDPKGKKTLDNFAEGMCTSIYIGIGKSNDENYNKLKKNISYDGEGKIKFNVSDNGDVWVSLDMENYFKKIY